MVTSYEDTMIDEIMWNYCEVTTTIPSCKENTYKIAKKKSRFDDLEFVDSPPLRVVIDTTKNDRIHATSLSGKASILSGKTRTTNRICRPYLEIANLLQDAYINAWKAPEPKYMPYNLGGYNAPPLYNDAANLYLAMKAYRGGNYDRVYGTATQEAIEAVKQTELGNPTYPIMSSVLRERDEEYYFATYKNLVMIPDSDYKDDENRLPMPAYKKAGIMNEISSVESRLIQTKHLMTRSQALVEMARTERINELITTLNDVVVIKDLNAAKRKAGRARTLGATRANVAFRNLLARTATEKDVTCLYTEGWKQVFEGQREFTYKHARWIQRGSRGEYLTLMDIPSAEDMYFRSEVSKEETLRVEGLFIAPRINKPGVYTEARVGLWEISKSMEQWAHDIYIQLLTKRDELKRPLDRSEILEIYTVDREWINDDSLVIEMIKDATRHRIVSTSDIILVSSDEKLAKRAARTCNVRVLVCEPRKLYMHFSHLKWNSTTEVTPQEIYKILEEEQKGAWNIQVPVLVIIDTGSMHSELSTLSKKERKKILHTTHYDIVERQVVRYGVNQDGRRYTTYEERVVSKEKRMKLRSQFSPRGTSVRGNSTHSYSTPSASQGSMSDITWSEYSTRRMKNFRSASSRSSA
jgi:rRNA-processing protein FCF1